MKFTKLLLLGGGGQKKNGVRQELNDVRTRPLLRSPQKALQGCRSRHEYDKRYGTYKRATNKGELRTYTVRAMRQLNKPDKQKRVRYYQ